MKKAIQNLPFFGMLLVAVLATALCFAALPKAIEVGLGDGLGHCEMPYEP